MKSSPMWLQPLMLYSNDFINKKKQLSNHKSALKCKKLILQDESVPFKGSIDIVEQIKSKENFLCSKKDSNFCHYFVSFLNSIIEYYHKIIQCYL